MSKRKNNSTVFFSSSYAYNNSGRKLTVKSKTHRPLADIKLTTKLNNNNSNYRHYVPKNNHLKVYWIRHATSCNNINSKLGNFFYGYKNPLIIQPAIAASCAIRDYSRINNVDIVCCSPLIRAIQTAILMFPDKFMEGKIRVLPTLFEKGFTGNKKDTPLVTKVLLDHWIDYVIDKEMTKTSLPKSKMQTCIKFLNKKNKQKNLDKLYQWYNYKEFKNLKGTPEEKVILPLAKCIEKISISLRPKGWRVGNLDIYPTVAIISHGNFLKRYITRNRKRRLKNNQIFFRDYYLDYDRQIGESANSEKDKLFENGCKYRSKKLKCKFEDKEFTIKSEKKKIKDVCKRKYY